MKNKPKNEEKSAVSTFFSSTGSYIKRNYAFLLLFIAGFLAVTFVNFFKISTTDSVATFVLNDFEIGQISDRTIIADKSLPADEYNPIEIQKGEKVIKKGFPVTEEGFAKLKKMAESPVYLDFRAFADSELYIFVLGILWYLLFAFVPFGRKVKIGEVVIQVIFFLLIYSCSSLCGKLQLFSSPFSICVILPTALCILLLSILYGQLSAVLFSFIVALGVLIGSSWQIVPFLYTLSSCLYSSAIVRKINRRIDMIIAALVIAALNVVFILLIAVVFNQTLSDLAFVFTGTALNGFLSGILALGLLTPFELMLNTASNFRLMDLSDLNNPLMKKMLIQASGTYQHSLMVAQLAENACREIGANPLIARVGAYYHDIGKMDQSQYFVENQKGMNKHDELSTSLSVSVIRSHVKIGVEKAHQLHLPQVVIDIISEHHGNSVIAYFYNTACEAAKKPVMDYIAKNNITDPLEVKRLVDAVKLPNAADFSYSGNPPSTKESAVVMLADTVEAACRTIENPTEEKLEAFINQLIQQKADHNQLNNCDLTFRDYAKIKEAFLKILTGFYHSRIEYPDQEKDKQNIDKEEKTTAVAEEAVRSSKTKTDLQKETKTVKRTVRTSAKTDAAEKKAEKKEDITDEK